MIKFSSTLDYDFGIEPVSIITDRARMVKRAADKLLMKFARTKGQTDVHLIALGAYEGTGANRNFDIFLEDDCRKNNQTFVKAGRAVHRHHKNKRNDPKYGNIKAAAYNEDMRRIELVVGLDDDKCSDILTEIEKKGEAAFSMATYQKDGDICSWCSHNAKSDHDRCTHIENNLGEMSKEGSVCAMINPNPNWFEISYVKRPADRIGYSLKIASDNYRPKTASDYLSLYKGFELPTEFLLVSKTAESKRKLARKLAEMEKHLDAVAVSKPSDSKDKYLKEQAPKLNESEKLSDDVLDKLRSYEPSALLGALADHGIVFSPEDFMKYLFGPDKVKKDDAKTMSNHLPFAFNSFMEDADIFNDEKFEPSSLNIIPKELKSLMAGLTGGFSMFDEPAHNRVMRITIIGGPKKTLKASAPDEKTASVVGESLAKYYTMYKLSALHRMEKQGKLDEALLWNVLTQNR